MPEPGPTAEVRHEDWGTDDLSDAEHAGVLLVDVDLSETTGSGASFTDCTFRDCRFNSAAYDDCAFTNCTFVNCNFFEASFTGCKLVGSRFDRCRFDLLTVRGGDWSFTALPTAELGRTSWTDVRMREADLGGARLQEATLQRIDLSGADLRRVDLTGADLRGSDLSALDPREAVVAGAVIDALQAVTLATTLGLQVREDAAP